MRVSARARGSVRVLVRVRGLVRLLVRVRARVWGRVWAGVWVWGNARACAHIHTHTHTHTHSGALNDLTFPVDTDAAIGWWMKAAQGHHFHLHYNWHKR